MKSTIPFLIVLTGCLLVSASVKLRGAGKTDWNFQPAGKPFDTSKWESLKGKQPFYAQVNLSETQKL